MTTRSATLLLLFAAGSWAADLPVRHVVLYKHGVGYFERSGTLGPGESARLDFKAEDMNDVLKSLTIEEKGGGKVAGLRYDSSIPLEQKLAEFPFAIERGQPLTAVLDQLKGARVEITLGGEKLAGIIVGSRMVPGDKDRAEREQVSLMLDSGDLRTIELAATSSIHFPDPKVQLQFRDYLAAVAGARAKDKRSVYVDSTDAKAHEVAASYIIPSPVWKSSYRLVLSSAQPVLEGWAIVDNTTGEDWTNVRMSLISGKPISFVSALYEPKYVQRLTADLAEYQAVAPTVYEGAVSKDSSSKLAAAPPPMAAKQRAGAGMAGGVMGGVPGNSATMEATVYSSINPSASGRELGDLFEYSMSAPVTVRKNESAMLPFLQEKIKGRKLLIYSDASMKNPFNAAELTNSTGKTLDGGPITVFDAGAYAGEALVETVKAGDKRLINYAVDLGTRITTNIDSKADLVREIHAQRGMLTARFAADETRTYTIRNVDPKPKTLIIEHPMRPQYHLLSQKPGETTANAYRFEIELKPDSTEKMPVSEERVYNTTTYISSLTPEALLVYVQNKNLSDAARAQLQKIVDAKKAVASLEAQSRDIEASINSLHQDQERLRQNINSLNGVNGQQQQVQLYATKLATQEGEIGKLRDQQSDVQKSRAAAQTALESLMEKMEF